MKRFAIVISVLLLAAAVSAQEYGATPSPEKPVVFSLGIGAGLPVGTFNKNYDVGLHALGGVGFNIASVPGLQLIPTVEFHTFKLNEAAFIKTNFDNPQGIQVDLGATNMFLVGANGQYSFGAMESRLQPFIRGGAGAAFIKFGKEKAANAPVGWVGPHDNQNVTKFYYNAGVGVDIAAGSAMTVFLEGRFVGIPEQTVDLNFIPLTVGIRF